MIGKVLDSDFCIGDGTAGRVIYSADEGGRGSLGDEERKMKKEENGDRKKLHPVRVFNEHFSSMTAGYQVRNSSGLHWEWLAPWYQ